MESSVIAPQFVVIGFWEFSFAWVMHLLLQKTHSQSAINKIIKNHSLIINLRLFTGNKVASPIKVVFVKLASSTYPKT